jgi:hypothetical protein
VTTGSPKAGLPTLCTGSFLSALVRERVPARRVTL